MAERVDSVVIGAGQAGLSISYYLTQQGRDHLILEQASSTIPAWRKRWDSFSLVLPNWTVRLPGLPVPADVEDSFFTRDDLVAHFDEFTATFNPPIRFDTQVISIEQNGRYLVRTSRGDLEANNVIVATGTFQQPRIPAFGAAISPDIVQVHTDHYRNPAALPDDAVLVVGAGQSGSQVADELYRNGRRVYLSIGGAPRVPRFYRGRDVAWWLDRMGFFDVEASALEFEPGAIRDGPGGER